MSQPKAITFLEQQAGATYRLLRKFHAETDCGKRKDDHWAECNALVNAFCWGSWEIWQLAVLKTGNEQVVRLGVVTRVLTETLEHPR